MSDGDKQAILQSIRENLAAALPVGHEAAHAIAPLPAVVDRESLVRQFGEELTMLGADVFLAQNADDAQGYIRDVVRRHQAQRIALSAAPIFSTLTVAALLVEEGAQLIPLPPQGQSEGLEEYKRQLMTADLGITGADAGLAESGTLVLRTGHTEGRLASLLPPVHLAIIKADQLLPGVAEFIMQSKCPPSSSAVIFITGPSRTADIELTLTVGVHGPKQLHVLVLA